MDKLKILFLILLVLLALTLIGWHFSNQVECPHGGTVKDAGNFKIEAKTSSPYFYAFLLDKKNTPLSNKGISCEVRFIFSDHTDMKFAMTPFDDDGFIVKLITQEFIQSQVQFNVHGESVTAKFDNQNFVVRKK